MSFCVERHLPLLEIIRKANPKLRKSIIKHSDSGFIDAISEICLNYLNGNICCTKDQYGTLAKHRESMRRLAKVSRNSARKKTVKGRVNSREVERKILLQKGEGFWFALLPVVTELTHYFISKALEKK